MKRVISAALAAFVLCGTAAKADDSVLSELYGQGVHAYFAGDYTTAHGLLTNAIKQGSTDPRAYIFRGLTYSMLGRPDEAQADFKMGAELELNSQDRVYPVSDSLQRIQGRVRMQIERQRQMARIAARSKPNRVEQTRYDEPKRTERGNVRDQARESSTPPRPSTPPALSPEPGDPFADANAAQPQKAAPKKAPAVAPPSFSTSPPTPAAKPAAAEADPFGAPPVAPTPGVADPFSTAPPPSTSKPAPAIEDPFGSAPAAQPAKPTAPPPAPAEADPFGGPAPAPSTPAAPAKKDDATSDPFGDDKPAPAAKPAAPAPAADPFGA